MRIPATMTEQVDNAVELDLSYRVLHPDAIIRDTNTKRNIRVPFASITSKYRDFLKSIVIEVELDDKEQLQYLYKPKSLSDFLYGTTEFWNDLLILNNYYSVSEFKPVKIKIYDPTEFKRFLNEILILEDIV